MHGKPIRRTMRREVADRAAQLNIVYVGTLQDMKIHDVYVMKDSTSSEMKENFVELWRYTPIGKVGIERLRSCLLPQEDLMDHMNLMRRLL